jgi:hypothetical protein
VGGSHQIWPHDWRLRSVHLGADLTSFSTDTRRIDPIRRGRKGNLSLLITYSYVCQQYVTCSIDLSVSFFFTWSISERRHCLICSRQRETDLSNGRHLRARAGSRLKFQQKCTCYANTSSVHHDSQQLCRLSMFLDVPNCISANQMCSKRVSWTELCWLNIKFTCQLSCWYERIQFWSFGWVAGWVCDLEISSSPILSKKCTLSPKKFLLWNCCSRLRLITFEKQLIFFYFNYTFQQIHHLFMQM